MTIMGTGTVFHVVAAAFEKLPLATERLTMTRSAAALSMSTLGVPVWTYAHHGVAVGLQQIGVALIRGHGEAASDRRGRGGIVGRMEGDPGDHGTGALGNAAQQLDLGDLHAVGAGLGPNGRDHDLVDWRRARCWRTRSG